MLVLVLMLVMMVAVLVMMVAVILVLIMTAVLLVNLLELEMMVLWKQVVKSVLVLSGSTSDSGGTVWCC